MNLNRQTPSKLTNINALTWIALFGAAISFVGCTTSNRDSFTKEDESYIRKMITDYQEGWLENDSTKIMNLFADTATLIPSGLLPVRGSKEIRGFWWPNDSSKTTIDSYRISLLEVGGSGNMAYSFENGKLSWNYEKGNFRMSKDQESYEVTIFQRNEETNWKIIKRIWTDIKQ